MKHSDTNASAAAATWFCAAALWVIACCAILVTMRVEQVTDKVQEGWREVERLKQLNQQAAPSTRTLHQ